MSNEEYLGKILYNNRMSEEWLFLLEDAPEFNPFDLKSITALLVAPCDLGTVVLRENQRSLYDGSSLETLRTFYQTHRLFDYTLTRRCFSMINGFSSYKVPFINWHFALCPLEAPENCSWVNPLDIYELRTIRGICFAELTTGLVLEIPTQKRSFLQQLEKAIYSLCYLRREYSITLHYNGNPLDYLHLPDTPLMQLLSRRDFLQCWITDRGAFHQRYMSELLLKYQEDSDLR
ncbi:hypothetical protein [Enterococcus sp. DIV0756]|uniref:hypothetical protein n=1 Tax=Enterococcus sp. DIV0756 TaxID=2774636 RepID=UPI003F1FE82D